MAAIYSICIRCHTCPCDKVKRIWPYSVYTYFWTWCFASKFCITLLIDRCFDIRYSGIQYPCWVSCLITARKRSLRRLCFCTCLSVHRGWRGWYPSMPCRSPGGSPGPNVGGSPGPHRGCIPACTETDTPRWTATAVSYWNAFLFFCESLE